MDAPVNTLNYMIAGYAVIFGVMIAYIASMILRWVRLRREQAMLDDIVED